MECVGSSFRNRCTQTINIAQPGYQGNPSDTCANNIQEKDLVFNTQHCGVTFSINNWEMPVNLTVTGYVDNVYNTDDRTAHIRLKINEGSSTGLSGVWNTVNIPDIQVRLYRFFFLNSNRNQNVQNWKRIFQNQGNKTSHITTQWLVCSPWMRRIVDSICVVVNHRPYCDMRCSYIARLHKFHMGHIKATSA